MKFMQLMIMVFGLAVAGAAVGPGSATDAEMPLVQAELLSDHVAARPGGTVMVGVRFDIAPEWHIYWKDSGEAGMPTRVVWEALPGVTFSDLLWPRPAVFLEAGDIATIGYKGEVLLIAEATLPTTLAPGDTVPITAHVEWLACKTICIPGDAAVTASLQIADNAQLSPHAGLFATWQDRGPTAEEEEEIRANYRTMLPEPDFLSSLGSGATRPFPLLLGLLFAFVGGLILNIMPCVLPILSLKVFRFLRQAQTARSAVLKENLVFTGGVLASFAVLAGLVIGLKIAGREIGWGFQFQEPLFVLVLAAVVFVFALALAGMFEINVALPGRMGTLASREGLAGSFWEGALATTLATPCTAPFLGAALGLAFTLSAPLILVFFSVVGLGLASPYLLLAVIPGWGRFLPKPGPWMEKAKQFMAFPLFATAIWLLWVLGQQAGLAAVVAALVFLLILGGAAWMISSWGTFTHPPKQRWAIRAAAILLVGATFAWGVKPRLTPAAVADGGMPASPMPDERSAISWEPFSLAALEARLGEGRTVFVDFTAEWCLTCQVNKRGALNSSRVAAALMERDIIPMRADWTSRDAEITRVLRRLGRSGVPVYALFAHGDAAHPILLPELLTEDILLRAFERTESTRPTNTL